MKIILARLPGSKGAIMGNPSAFTDLRVAVTGVRWLMVASLIIVMLAM